MSNGFTNLPTSLLGAVNIGGNLVVQGTTRSVGLLSTDASLAVGLTPNIVRAGNFTGYGPGISGNLALDAATRDNAGVSAALEALGANANPPKYRAINAAGTALDKALANMLGTDFTLHTLAINTTENTIFTKTVPANTLGAQGGFVVEVAWALSGAPTGTLTLRVKFGGVTILTSITAIAATTGYVRMRISNRTAASQIFSGLSMLNTTIDNNTSLTGAVDTTVDQNLLVTAQKSVAADAGRVDMVSLTDANSFGPV